MTFGTMARSVSMLGVIALAPSSFGASDNERRVKMEREGVELIRQVEEAARDVRHNADRLIGFTADTTISKWTHYHHLTQIKDLVNEGLRPALTRLTNIQSELPEWKQQAIDKMIEAARTLAADTNDAILAKKDAGTVPPAMNAEYKALVARMYEHADTLVKASDAAGAYALARTKATEAGLEVGQK